MRTPTHRISAAAAAVSVVLAACGGGGSNQPQDTNLLPGQDAATVTAVPAPNYASGSDQAAAFARLNELRASAGLGLLTQTALLDSASAAHARWLEANGGGTTTTETAGTPGFTGVDALARFTAAGYPATAGYQLVQQLSVPPIDSLMNAPYSRALLLQYRLHDVAFDVAHSPTGNALVASAGRTATAYQSSRQWLTAWPVAGAQNVPTTLYRRGADPIPENNGADAGYPISVNAFDDDALEVTTFTLSESSGYVVPVKLIVGATDATLKQIGALAYAALVPLTPLKPSTTYKVHFEGKLDSQIAYGPNFGVRTLDWSFTTAP
jgi:hypothetical protein